jgi:hypothetical protein
MATTIPVPVASPVAIPVRDIVPWLILVAALGAVLLYFVGAEQGALSIFSGKFVHEFVHDGRHLLGFPCH